MDRALACLQCDHGPVKVNADEVICTSCRQVYPTISGVIDFRVPANDVSAGFSIDEDTAIGLKMASMLDNFTTFNEMLRLYEGIRARLTKGISIDRLEPAIIVEEDAIVPMPLSAEQLGHGYAILDKVPGYLTGSLIADPLHGIALEDGAGHGMYVAAMSERFELTYVLDLSLSYLMLARATLKERGIKNTVLVCASAERLPFRDDVFAFIHSNNVIEHISNQEKMLVESRRTLKPGGLFFLLSPNRFSMYFEPHFRLPGFGFFPRFISGWLVRRHSGQNIDDIGLRSLSELKRLLRTVYGSKVTLSFIPRRLEKTATGGLVRTFLTKALNSRITGGVADVIVNKATLGIMPYHVALCTK